MMPSASFSADPRCASQKTPQFMRTSRLTRGGRHLHYQLSILQQPERARACGAGTRANSDRRPVDPPPVVKLKIVSGNSFEDGTDITFDYDASFFLYASLEPARVIAHGRVQSQPNPPILTGVPASGMAYLDKPEQAGYFIFPDLSVRHEGKYVLSFSLFETTKHKDDFDAAAADADLPDGVDWRMDIKTAAFDVYSAKKFPGLQESTELSRTVSEQGCRVRIRREVRMRKKRDNKGDGGRRDDDNGGHRRVTPSPADGSNAALAARTPSISDSGDPRMQHVDQRRASGADGYGHGPPRPYDANGRHLSFGSHGQPQYQTPRHYAPPAMGPISPGGPYTPNGHTIRPEQSAHQSPQYARAEHRTYGHLPNRSLGQGHPSLSPVIKSEYHDRRQSMNYPPPSPSVYSSSNEQHRRESYGSYPSTPAAYAPPPAMPPIQSQKDRVSISSLLSKGSSKVIPPLEVDTEQPVEPRHVAAGDKRKHSETFGGLNHHQPLHSGQRPREIDNTRGEYKDSNGNMRVATFFQFDHSPPVSATTAREDHQDPASARAVWPAAGQRWS